MCKFNFECKLCGFRIEVKSEYQNVQDVVLEISSDCPNLESATQEPITLDAMHEIMVPKEKSQLIRVLHDHPHLSDCTAYDGIIDAIGKSLGRYYEIA